MQKLAEVRSAKIPLEAFVIQWSARFPASFLLHHILRLYIHIRIILARILAASELSAFT
jgi:hypothetical protein